MPRKTAAETAADILEAAADRAIAGGFDVLEIRCSRRRIRTITRAIDLVGARRGGMMRDERTIEDWAQDYPYSDDYVPRFWVPLFPDAPGRRSWEDISNESPDTVFL